MKIFITLKRNPIFISCHSPYSYIFLTLPPNPLSNFTDILSVSKDLPILGVSYKWLFYEWLLSFNIIFLRVIHVIAHVSNLFLFLAKYSVLWIYHILSIYLLSSWLAYWLVLYFGIMSNATLNIGIQIWTCFQFSWVYT